MAGTPGCLRPARIVELNLAREPLTPIRLHVFEKALTPLERHSPTIAAAPMMAITGVALNMNRPADQAMYDAKRIHIDKTMCVCFRVRNPRHREMKPMPNANMNTSGPKFANNCPRLGACASAIVPNTLFLEK